MLDISVAYNRFAFLGLEFLTWLWFMIENHPDRLNAWGGDLASLVIGNRLILENRNHESVETIAIKGDDAGLEEGMTALGKGALVSEMNLGATIGDYEWHFTIRGEGLSITNLKTPETEAMTSSEELEGVLLEKISLYERAVVLTETLFNKFIRLRLSEAWREEVVPEMRTWIFKPGQ